MDTQEKIDFSKYDDEKLRLWIRAYDLCPSTHLLYSEEDYKRAWLEQTKRIKELLKGIKINDLMVD